MQNDQELIKEYQNGDRSAFDKIVRRHLSNTIGFFYTITQDRMVSEDLAQDVFFKLFRHLKKFRFKSSFSTYLYRINLNTANSWFTRNKWKSFLSLEKADNRNIEIRMWKMNGIEKNFGVKLVSYQKNNAAWL